MASQYGVGVTFAEMRPSTRIDNTGRAGTAGTKGWDSSVPKRCPSPRALIWTTVLVGYLVIAPSPVAAEPFVDVYGGVAFTTSDTVTASIQDFPLIGPSPPVESATRRGNFGNSPLVGVRGGYWLESIPWLGMAIDVSHFEAEATNVDITVIPSSFLMMLRWPLLKNNAFPKGRLQPYMGVGLALFHLDSTADFRPTLSKRVRE